ncbi:MAG: hypothetical protein MUO76_04020 [Anaerolineaceae bacterium]|nr:hypothetical protein [Anaerolineaceae bacterium]
MNINPSDCTPESSEYTASSLQATLQIPNLEGGMPYCYFSTDGVSWARWPQFGFLAPDEGGYITGEPILQLLPNSLTGGQVYPRLDLFMECWGWQDGILVQLGDFYVEGMDPQYTGGQFVAGEGISAEVVFEHVNLIAASDFETLEPITLGGSDFVPKQDKLTQISPEIPRVYLSQTTDPEACGDHLPPDAQNFLGQLLYCFPYPEFDPNKGAVSSQPYLVWIFDSGPSCLAGIGEVCTSYPELLALAEENGGQVGFDVTSMSNAGNFI